MKRFYFWSILILSTMLFLPQRIWAQNDLSVWDGTAEIWTHGSGTETDPYLIESAQNLAWISEMVNSGVTEYTNTYFKLTTDIKIDSTFLWQPAGFDGNHYFKGNFDGDSHIVILYLTSNMKYLGLFGYVREGSICNLNLLGKLKSYSDDSPYIGMCGFAIYEFINNCNNYCDIEIEYYVTAAGGIAGCARNSTLTNCSNYGSIVSVHGVNSGGICGVGTKVTIDKSYNVGVITCSNSSCSGGIIGLVNASSHSTDTTTITNCYNTGDLIASNYVGGICGQITSSSSQQSYPCLLVNNSYNSGGLDGDGVRYGIANGRITNSYYLNTCGSTSGGGTSKTEAQMKSSSFPVILNSDSVVFVMDDHNVNQGYPIFGNEIYVVSEDATNITFNSATLNGTYSGNVDIKGFRYKETTDTVFNTVYCSLNAPYNYSISGLTEGTTYQYQYFVRKNGVSYYGDTKTFATISCDVSLNITMPTDAVCVGDDVVLIASAQSAYTSQFSFLWSTGDTGDTITPIENGTYLVTATADNACSQTASFSLSLYPSPHGTISGDTILCEGNTVTLTANGAWSYRWNTGTQGATISVSEPGTYSCLFTNEYGCSSEASVVVKYLSDFVISGNPNICIGESTVLSVPSVDSCIWNTGEHSFSINVTEAGNYRVTLYYGSCSSTISSNVILNPLPNVTIGGNTEVCEGSSAILVANGASTYHWSNGVTGSVNTVNTFGIYSVTGYSAQGCSNTASVTVMVYPLPVVNISGDTELCSGETTALTANGADTYLWNNGTNGAVLTTGLPGTYTVIATNAQGCSATASTYVTVNPLPNITISGNTAVCQGNTTTLVANGAATYQWNNGVSGAVNTIGTFGIYTVTGISAEGCSSTASATVVVYQLPVLNISGDTQLCSGETTTLTANGAATYLWNNGTTDAALTTGAAGTYTVIGTDEHGCYSTASIDVAVNYPSSTEVTVVECDSYEWQGITRTESGDYTWTGQTAAGCDSIITLHLTINESVTTEISETANNSYEWHGTTYTESGDYTWTGQTANGCDSTVTLHLTITTGVNEWSDGHFTVYPNPTTGMVNVRLDENGATWNVAEIQMFDVYGRLLNTVETCHGASLQTTQIDLSSYAPGIYLIKLVGDGRVIGVRKVVKR